MLCWARLEMWLDLGSCGASGESGFYSRSEEGRLDSNMEVSLTAEGTQLGRSPGWTPLAFTWGRSRGQEWGSGHCLDSGGAPEALEPRMCRERGPPGGVVRAAWPQDTDLVLLCGSGRGCGHLGLDV